MSGEGYAAPYEEVDRVEGFVGEETLPDEAPFEVGEEISSDVNLDDKPESDVLPAAKGVLIEIKKAEMPKSKKGDLMYLKLQMRLPEGILQTNEDGELVQKFVGKVVFTGMMDLLVWFDKATKTSSNYVAAPGKLPKALLGAKEFWAACGFPSTSFNPSIKTPGSRSEFCSSLVGTRLLVNVAQEDETELDQATGKYVKTGGLKNRFKGWKAVPTEVISE